MPSTDSTADQPLHPTTLTFNDPPNPARDARRRVRAERERRRAARALDRYMEIYEQAVAGAGGTLPILTAGERFVEAVGDYVLSELHHNGHYGVADPDPTGALADMCSQLPGCRPSTDGEHSASCEASIYRDQNTVKPSEVCPRTGEPGHLHAWQGGRCVS